MEKVHTTDRLAHLRKLMKAKDIDVYIVPSEDSHYSEYIAPVDARRGFISGFSGSAGTAVITAEKASLATDGRYFNQAATQLDDNWTLLKQGERDVPTWQEWTADQSEGGKRVGVDPKLITAAEARKLSDKIKKKGGAELKSIPNNLVDEIWGKDQPARPSNKIRVQRLEHSGKKVEEKIEDLRKELEKKKCSGFVLSMLDEIAWLFNLRGSDIPYNPVFFSYALVTSKDIVLYVDKDKVNDEVAKHLGEKVTIKPYSEVFSDIEALSSSTLATKDSEPTSKESASPKPKFMISNKASWALSQSLGGDENVEESRSPVGDAKAVKNEVELEGMRQCHIRDGAALIEYFAWLEEQVAERRAKLDEFEAASKLEEIRSRHDKFVGLSFPTISSVGPNAAIIHYFPKKGSCATIDTEQVYLCDSGAQYLDGTTDTTRTLHFGQPSELERQSYTLVLKGNIALELAKFPKGTSGFALDALARQHLWAQGLDYRHGTGHGVGSFLNVHEGPIGIGTRVQYSEVQLSVGNVISDEPGYYEDGKFGIRIENVVVVKETQTEHKFGGKPFLGFDHVTLVPMCRNLIDVNLLDETEKRWLNAYHEEVRENTKGFFEKDERSMKWLIRETQPY
ncbi:MAG: hypothetical protein M1822_010256 [Bathelium mastoideum]|nr:MAG: hypothetical protein M1822_010256 [Bathelium mastoideum]